MKHLLLIFILLFYCGANAQSGTESCAEGKMGNARYEQGEMKMMGMRTDFPANFLIHLDTTRKAMNFISGYEKYLKYRAHETELLLTYECKEWESLTAEQKQNMVTLEKQKAQSKADSIHQLNNNKKIEILVFNNTSDTVNLTIQDGSFQCLLEAKNQQGEWQEIEYWLFSKCGNSYYNIKFLPQQANSFVFEIPRRGLYSTQLRFKMRLAKGNYVYSNEFAGKIDPCEFSMDSKTNYWVSRQKRDF